MPNDLLAALDAWEPALRAVQEAKAAMEAGHYHRPLVDAYEAACARRDALAARIEALSGHRDALASEGLL